uniref:Uncharacterized protein n=1 Tax=Ditylenchus dipsaci TaxID=166011 RepID=A0A915E577_9BILA
MLQALNIFCLAALVGTSYALPGVTVPAVPNQPAVTVPNVPNVTVPNLLNVSAVHGSPDSTGVAGLIKVILGLLHGLLSILTNEGLKPVEDIIPSQLVGRVPLPSELLHAFTNQLPTGAPSVPGATSLISIIDGVVPGLSLVLIVLLKLLIGLLTAVLSILSGSPLPLIPGIIPDTLARLPLSALSLTSLLNSINQIANVGEVLNPLLGNPLVPAL